MTVPRTGAWTFEAASHGTSVTRLSDGEFSSACEPPTRPRGGVAKPEMSFCAPARALITRAGWVRVEQPKKGPASFRTPLRHEGHPDSGQCRWPVVCPYKFATFLVDSISSRV